MGSFSIWHWIIVLIVVVLVFGTKKLGNIGKDLGEGIKGFKKGLREGDEPPPAQLGSDKREATQDEAKQQDSSGKSP